MALKVKMNDYTRWQEYDSLTACVEEQDYSFSKLVDRFKILRQLGYLYEKEQVFETGREALWQENPNALTQAQVSESWQQKRVTEIILHFTHLITKEKLYLHLHWALYPNKELGRTVMQVIGCNPVEQVAKGYSQTDSDSFGDFIPRKRVIEASTSTSPYFEALLRTMDLIPGAHKWYDVSMKALQATDNDSLLTTLAKHHYTQRRVGRLSDLSESKKAVHWVGEFVKTNIPLEETSYLYLLVTQAALIQEGIARVHCELTPQIRILSTPQPLEEITIPDVGVLSLEKMPWEGLPFADYYDLPDLHMLVRTPMKEYEPHPDNLHEIFQNLYTEGYRYRREIAMVAGTLGCEDDTFLAGYDVDPDYLAHDLCHLTLEFVHPVTHRRKVVLISPKEILLRLCNGHWGAGMSHHYSCLFQDLSYDIRRFSDSVEIKSAFREEEIFPAPLLQSLLEEHHLIAPDQTAISRLMENADYRSWFSGATLDLCYWFGPQDFDSNEQHETETPDERKESIKGDAARCRRIFRYLHYPLAGTRTMHNGKTTVEVYANSTRERAFYLIYDDYNCFVRFADKYMDVNGVLTF